MTYDEQMQHLELQIRCTRQEQRNRELYDRLCVLEHNVEYLCRMLGIKRDDNMDLAAEVTKIIDARVKVRIDNIEALEQKALLAFDEKNRIKTENIRLRRELIKAQLPDAENKQHERIMTDAISTINRLRDEVTELRRK